MKEKNKNHLLLKLSSKITASYISNNKCEPEAIINIFSIIYSGLKNVESINRETLGTLVPAVPIEDSIREDKIVCLEDGKSFKMLKRHLASNYKMTPEQYRLKWNLPSDYPMVAPSYSKKRRELAKESGLGTIGKN